MNRCFEHLTKPQLDRLMELAGIYSENELAATAGKLLEQCINEAAQGNYLGFRQDNSRLMHTTMRHPYLENARKLRGSK